MKRIITVLIAALAVMAGLMTISPAPAMGATENEESESSIVIESYSYSDDYSSATAKESVRIKLEGKTQLSFFEAGVTAWSFKKAMKCKAIFVKVTWSKAKIKKKLKKAMRKVGGTWCVRLKQGSTWANSGKEGQRPVPFSATVKCDFSLMTLKPGTKVKRGIWEHMGALCGGTFHQVCKNWWMIGVVPTLTENDVHLVESELDIVEETVVEASASATATAKGYLECPSGKLWGEASASASASSFASAFAKVRFKAQAVGDLKLSLIAKLKESVMAIARAKAAARIKLVCKDQPPPENPKPNLLEVTQVNDLEVNATMVICAAYLVADGRTATLTFAPVFGTIVGQATFQVTGQDSKCVTLKAPGEVPQGHAGEGLPAGKDKVKYKLVDNSSGEKDVAETVYTVHPTAPHPLRGTSYGSARYSYAA